MYIPPETNNEMFNGQYVQIDPLRYGVQPMQYSGQSAPFRLQNGRPVYLQQKIDDPDNPEITTRNVYDRVYEDMLKYRNSPGLQNQMVSFIQTNYYMINRFIILLIFKLIF